VRNIIAVRTSSIGEANAEMVISDQGVAYRDGSRTNEKYSVADYRAQITTPSVRTRTTTNTR
jgi:hypothetical protein